MVLVPSQKPYFEVNMTTKPFPMPRACDKGAQTRGENYSYSLTLILLGSDLSHMIQWVRDAMHSY